MLEFLKTLPQRRLVMGALTVSILSLAGVGIYAAYQRGQLSSTADEWSQPGPPIKVEVLLTEQAKRWLALQGEIGKFELRGVILPSIPEIFIHPRNPKNQVEANFDTETNWPFQLLARGEIEALFSIIRLNDRGEEVEDEAILSWTLCSKLIPIEELIKPTKPIEISFSDEGQIQCDENEDEINRIGRDSRDPLYKTFSPKVILIGDIPETEKTKMIVRTMAKDEDDWYVQLAEPSRKIENMKVKRMALPNPNLPEKISVELPTLDFSTTPRAAESGLEGNWTEQLTLAKLITEPTIKIPIKKVKSENIRGGTGGDNGDGGSLGR